MVKGFEIDHGTKLNGLMPAYQQHVLVCTGKDDWPSKIEDEDGGENLAADLRGYFGRGGSLSDVSLTMGDRCAKRASEAEHMAGVKR